MLKKILKCCCVALLAMFCFVFAFACGKHEDSSKNADFDVKFATGVKTEAEIGELIDLESLVVKVPNATFIFKVTFTDSFSGEPTTRTFRSDYMFTPDTEGEHTIVYEVTLNNTTKSAAHTINVVRPEQIIITEEAVEGVANTYQYRATVTAKDGAVTSVTLPEGIIDYDARTEDDELDLTDNLAYIGATDAYGVGDTVKVYFTGKNLPGISVLCGNPQGDDAVIGRAVGDGTGIFFENGGRAGDGIASALGYRLYPAGPYRAHGNDDCYYNYSVSATIPYAGRRDVLADYTGGGTLDPDYATVLKGGSMNCPVGFSNLVDDQDYRFELRMNAANEAEFSFTYKLYTIDGAPEKLVWSKTVSWTKENSLNYLNDDGTSNKTNSSKEAFDEFIRVLDLNSKTIAFYGNKEGVGDCTFSYEIEKAAEVPVNGIENAYSHNAQVTVGDTATTVKLAQGSITNWELGTANAPVTHESDVAYLGFTDIWTVGTTIGINFHGKNIPDLGLFLDGADESLKIGQPVGGGTGIYLSMGGNLPEDNAIRQRLIGCAPYRLDSGEAGYMFPYNSRVDAITYNPNNAAEMGYKNLDENKDYRLEIKLLSVSAGSGSWQIDFYEVTDGDKGEAIASFTKSFSSEIVNFESTAFAFYGIVLSEIEFSYDVTVSVPSETISTYNATYDQETGAATLQKCEGGTSYTDCPYIDFGEYADGGKVTIEFSGKYKPNVQFFAQDVTKQMKTDTKAGIMFSDDAIGVDYRIWPSTEVTSGAIVFNNEDLKKIAYNNLAEDKNYVLEITCVKGETDYEITVKLSSKAADGTLTEISTYTGTRSALPENAGTHIVVYGSRITALNGLTITVEAQSE